VTHLRQIMLEELPASSLLRSYYSLLHSRGRTIRSIFPVFSRTLRPAAHPGIPSSALHETEAVAY
jgi:hypothetical protein